MPSSRIAELASVIQIETSRVDEFFSSQGIPAPSFDVDAPLGFVLPDDIAASREIILEATDELHSLMQGPIELLNIQSAYGSTSLQAIYRFRIAFSFPIGETATFPQIAEKCGLPESDVRRILRNAMTSHIFHEPENGVIAHTAATKALVQVPLLDHWIGMVLEELWPCATRVVDALSKWPGSQEPELAGFNLAHGVQDTIFNELSKRPGRAKRFKEAMAFFQSSPGFEPFHLLEKYDWGASDRKTVVDVGGSHGIISIELAKKFPQLYIVVQDLPDVIAEGSKNVPDEVSNRVAFMAHDFFLEQPVKNADVYFFRWIFHDWSDKYCIRILRGLIPALKSGARVLINEFCLPEPGMVSYYQEKMVRGFDLTMLGMQNSKERDPNDWENLFHDADSRFKLVGITIPPKSKLAIIEVCWDEISASDAGKA